MFKFGQGCTGSLTWISFSAEGDKRQCLFLRTNSGATRTAATMCYSSRSTMERTRPKSWLTFSNRGRFDCGVLELINDNHS